MQISSIFKSVEIDEFHQILTRTKTDNSIQQEIAREVKCYMVALMNT
jgi:hypothetical protein